MAGQPVIILVPLVLPAYVAYNPFMAKQPSESF